MGICHGVYKGSVASWRLLFMHHLRVQGLLNQSPNASIKWLDFRTYPLAEFCRCQMDVQTSRVCALVTGNQSNVLQARPSAFQDGAALVAKGMRGECWEADLLSYPLNDLVKGGSGERTTWVTCRFRQENWTEILAIVSSDERTAISFQVAAQEVEDRRRNRHVPHAPPFGRFRADRHDPVCPIEVIDT